VLERDEDGVESGDEGNEVRAFAAVLRFEIKVYFLAGRGVGGD
jgi:hypothetical protein